MEENFTEQCTRLQEQLQKISEEVKSLVKHSELDTLNIAFTPKEKETIGDMKGNIMLSYRHLEDAIVRLSRVRQSYSTIGEQSEPINTLKVNHNQTDEIGMINLGSFSKQQETISDKNARMQRENESLFSQQHFEGQMPIPEGQINAIDFIGKSIRYGEAEIGIIESTEIVGNVLQYHARIFRIYEDLFNEIVIGQKAKYINPSVGYSIEEDNVKRPPFIVINGKKIQWDKEEISYEKLIELAGFKSDAIVSVTYNRGWKPVNGSLIPGKSIPTIDGMYFNAVITGNA